MSGFDELDGDLSLLRSLVARELETINSYKKMASECSDPETAEFIGHIVDEEKFHIADTLRAIALLDPDQADLLERGFAAGHRPGEVPRAGQTRGDSGLVASLEGGESGVIVEPNLDVDVRARGQKPEPGSRSEGDQTGDLASTKGDGSAGNLSRNPGRDLSAAFSLTVGSLRGVPQAD